MAIWGAAYRAGRGGDHVRWVLMISRLGVGVGEAACAPTATSWIGDLVPPAKRARALALFMLGVPVGGALSYFFSGPIAQAYGWRMAMVIAAVPAFVLLPALLFLHEPERGASETHPCRRKRRRPCSACCESPRCGGSSPPARCSISTCTRSEPSCRRCWEESTD